MQVPAGCLGPLAALLMLLFVPPVVAQTAAVPVKPAPVRLPQLDGKTIDGTAFNLSMLEGKVVLVLVMFGSAGRTACRNKMP